MLLLKRADALLQLTSADEARVNAIAAKKAAAARICAAAPHQGSESGWSDHQRRLRSHATNGSASSSSPSAASAASRGPTRAQ